MKSVVMLWVACLKEAGDQYRVRTNRDLAYALSRVEKEGLSFLGITLPNFEKDLLTAVARGYAGSDLFAGFTQRGGLPTFMSGFLCQIFDVDGLLRDDADPSLLRAVRQVLLLVSKTEAPYSKRARRRLLQPTSQRTHCLMRFRMTYFLSSEQLVGTSWVPTLLHWNPVSGQETGTPETHQVRSPPVSLTTHGMVTALGPRGYRACSLTGKTLQSHLEKLLISEMNSRSWLGTKNTLLG